MKKSLNVRSIMVLIGIIAFLAGCAINQDNESEEGFLVLGISDGFSAKTIEPDVTMEIATFTVKFYGPNKTTIDLDPPDIEKPDLTYPVDSVTVPLKPGEWYITVDAYNDDKNTDGTPAPVKIAFGEKTIQIVRGVIQNEDITVTPLEGTGYFDVYVQWTAGLLGNINESPFPKIVDSLMLPDGTQPSQGSGIPGNLSFTLGTTGSLDYFLTEDSVKPEYKIPAGYYRYSIKLYDEVGNKVWGTIEIVRILAVGHKSEVIYNLVNDINQGSVDAITIIPDLDNPIDINFTCSPEEVVFDYDSDEKAFTAFIPTGVDTVVIGTEFPNGERIDTYEWYPDGEKDFDETGSTYTIYRTDFNPGAGDVHELGVIVHHSEDLVFSSRRLIFTWQ